MPEKLSEKPDDIESFFLGYNEPHKIVAKRKESRKKGIRVDIEKNLDEAVLFDDYRDWAAAKEEDLTGRRLGIGDHLRTTLDNSKTEYIKLPIIRKIKVLGTANDVITYDIFVSDSESDDNVILYTVYTLEVQKGIANQQ